MTTNADGPIREVCEERPAEGTFWVSSVVCRDCAECAISDGHMKPQDFEWWAPVLRPREPRCE